MFDIPDWVGYVVVIGFVLYIVFSIFSIIGKWKLFKKSGKYGYEAVVPFYLNWTLIDIAGLNKYWFVLSICPNIILSIYTNWVLYIICYSIGILVNIAIVYNLKEKFHKSKSWFILAVFFGNILIPVLGYSKTDVYDKDAVVDGDSYFKNLRNKIK